MFELLQDNNNRANERNRNLEKIIAEKNEIINEVEELENSSKGEKFESEEKEWANGKLTLELKKYWEEMRKRMGSCDGELKKTKICYGN